MRRRKHQMSATSYKKLKKQQKQGRPTKVASGCNTPSRHGSTKSIASSLQTTLIVTSKNPSTLALQSKRTDQKKRRTLRARRSVKRRKAKTMARNRIQASRNRATSNRRTRKAIGTTISPGSGSSTSSSTMTMEHRKVSQAIRTLATLSSSSHTQTKVSLNWPKNFAMKRTTTAKKCFHTSNQE